MRQGLEQTDSRQINSNVGNAGREGTMMGVVCG